MVLLLQSGDGFPLLIPRRYISYYIAQLCGKKKEKKEKKKMIIIPAGAITEYPMDLVALKRKLD